MDIAELKDHFDIKFDSLNLEMQNNNTTVKTMQNDINELKGNVEVIKENILANCKKLDGMESKINELLAK